MANLDFQSKQGATIQNSKPKRKLWLWACVGFAILICVVLGIFAFIVFSPSSGSFPLNGKVSFPSTVKKGDDFDFTITVTNPTTNTVFIKHFALQSDLNAPSLLDGARVMSVEPNMESEAIVGKDVQFPYFREIKSGETLTVIFHMRAENTGTYYEDVGVYSRHPFLADPAFITVFQFGPAEIVITP
jgi:hypothetical protein